MHLLALRDCNCVSNMRPLILSVIASGGANKQCSKSSKYSIVNISETSRFPKLATCGGVTEYSLMPPAEKLEDPLLFPAPDIWPLNTVIYIALDYGACQ